MTTPSQAQARFEKAYAYHNEGQLALAQALYEEVLAMEPNHVEALHLSGVIAAQTNDLRKAAELIVKAIAIQPGNPALNYTLGLVHNERKDYRAAVASFDKAIAIKPDYFEAFIGRGNALYELKHFDDAVASFDGAIAIKPDLAEAYYNQGNALKKLEKLDAAVTSFDNAIAIRADFAEAFYNRGNTLLELKKLDEALASFDNAIAIRPGYHEAYSNRGNTLMGLKRFDAALESFDEAIAIKPDYHAAYANRGNALLELKRNEAALESYDKAIAIKPDYYEAYSNRGVVLQELKKLDEAIASYDKAIAIKPDYHEATLHKSLALLSAGKFRPGWELYESRWNVDKFTSPKRNFKQPLWLGCESIAGKTILLHSEQGFGDAIQFCRYVPLVADSGARVILEVDLSLRGLLENLGGVAEVVVKETPLPDFDCHCPLMSLPLAFKTDWNTIPRPQQYLKSAPARLNYWNERLGKKSNRKVGLVWSGSDTFRHYSDRSIPLSTMIQHLPEGFTFVSLQKEVRDADKKALESNPYILHYGDELKDFADTAAICELMDVVVSIDTSVAHLGGALGRPTFVLLPFSPDWRWLPERDDSPWYPTMRLFRQQKPDDWSGPLVKLNSALRSH